MSEDNLDHLKSLHTAAIDARHGYEEALKDADGHGLTGLFHDMIELHTKNGKELGAILVAAGAKPEDDGSFMSTVHRTIMSIRGLFGGLGESVLPGLIDGEKRNVSHYDTALQSSSLAVNAQAIVSAQRDRIQAAIARMEAEKANADRAPAHSGA